MLSLLATLFGGSIIGWAGHAFKIRSQQMKGAPPIVANAVMGIENGVVAPVVTAVAQQELANLANPATATPLPSGKQIGQVVGTAALSAVVSAVEPASDPAPSDAAPPAGAGIPF